LQINRVLKSKTIKEIRKNLQDMPSSISEVFNQTLLRVKNEDSGSAMGLRVFLWLAFTKIALPFAALAHALSMDPNSKSVDYIDKENLPAIEVLVDICCGFVMVDGDGNLRFVHFTVQEYFKSHPEKLLPFDESAISKVCLSYLSLKEFESIQLEDSRKISQRLEEYPLLYYACHWWADHINPDSRSEIEPRILGIYLNKAKYHSYSQIFYSVPSGSRRRPWLPGRHNPPVGRPSKGYTPLHNAANFRIPSVVQQLISKGEDPCAHTPDGYTPLHVAVEANDETTVKLLLTAGAKSSHAMVRINGGQIPKGEKWVTWTSNQESPNIRNTAISSECIADPMTLAAALGHGDLLDVFLNNKCSTKEVSEALENATEFHQEHIVARILTHFPSIDHRHPIFAQVLTNAASKPRNDAVLRTLLTLRPGIDDHDRILTEVFPLICRFYPEFVVEFLNKGAKVNGPPPKNKYHDYEGPPLKVAIDTQNDTLARFLISKGADVSLKFRVDPHLDWDLHTGITSLQLAAKNGLENLVELLLDEGADIENEGDWNTPLTIAAYHGQKGVVEILLKHNADVEGSKTSPLTPLIACATDRGENVGLAKTLIESGADTNGDHGHGNPLQHAVTMRYAELAQLLLDNGADSNRRGSCEDFEDHHWSQTPLHIAILLGSQKCAFYYSLMVLIPTMWSGLKMAELCLWKPV
jgi:ankyrin repeat protein